MHIKTLVAGIAVGLVAPVATTVGAMMILGGSTRAQKLVEPYIAKATAKVVGKILFDK